MRKEKFGKEKEKPGKRKRIQLSSSNFFDNNFYTQNRKCKEEMISILSETEKSEEKLQFRFGVEKLNFSLNKLFFWSFLERMES